MIYLIIVVIIIIIIIYYLYYYIYESFYHFDYACINKSSNMKIYEPKSINKLSKFMLNNDKPICIKGAGYSHGGHTLLDNGIQIDMKNINHIVAHDNNTVTVGSGCKWHDLIVFLSKHNPNRSVSIMQSYYNFSIGGSVSVNCHGRGINGTISDTIINMRVLCTDGIIYNCSRSENVEVFNGVIGGYSLLGIIIDVTLETTENDIIESIISIDKVNTFFDKQLDNKILFYNGNIYPNNPSEIVNISWVKSNKAPTNNSLVRKQNSFSNGCGMLITQLLRRFNIMQTLKYEYEKVQYNDLVHYKSYEIGYDVNMIAVLSNHPTTNVLQEYFIPTQHIKKFLKVLAKEINKINIINISLRFVKKITNSILNYAPVDSYAVVLYINVLNYSYGISRLKEWTNNMLDLTSSLNGKYYLPYALVYNKEKILAMYDFKKMFELKNKYDKKNLIRNQFLEYLI